MQLCISVAMVRVATWFNLALLITLYYSYFTGMYAESDDSVDEHATLVHIRRNRHKSDSSSDASSNNSDSNDDSIDVSDSDSNSSDDDSEDGDADDHDDDARNTNGKLKGNFIFMCKYTYIKYFSSLTIL
jgi:hypothetical protein